MTEIAEHIAANPPEFRIAALNCSDTFQLYLSHLSKSTMNYLSHKFEISNLTSPSLQYSFMYCTGLKIYQFFSDDKGNIRKPNQFHSCKKCHFKTLELQHYQLATQVQVIHGYGNCQKLPQEYIVVLTETVILII